MCALEMWGVRAHFCISGKEAVTESEYGKREQKARAERLTLADCATIYAEDYHAWGDADYETDEDGEQYPTDAAWYRVRDQKVIELRALVKAGTLSARGKGKRQKITCGAFYDWLGKPVPVVPDFGIAFDVQPDHRAREVARARRDHEFIGQLLDRGACKLELPLDMEAPLATESPGRFGVEIARVLAVRIRAGARESWQELRAIEEQVEAITEEFDGEDVLYDRARQHLDETKAILVELHKELQEYTGTFELPDPDADMRATIQRIVDNEVKHVPTRWC